jgi:hypothetical protein
MSADLAHVLEADPKATAQLPLRTFLALVRFQNPAAQIVG